MKIYTNLTARKADWKRETIKGLSATEPNQAVTPQELLRRYATGQPLGFKNTTPIYDEDESFDVPEFYKMSELDKLHHLQEHHEEVKSLTTDYNQSVLKYQRDQQEHKKQQLKDKSNKPTNEPTKERSDAISE